MGKDNNETEFIHNVDTGTNGDKDKKGSLSQMHSSDEKLHLFMLYRKR